MTQLLQSTSDAQLFRLRQRIERWRLTRPRCRGMPAQLWDEAASLARQLGVHPVKRVLGLNYESLRKRVQAQEAESSRTPAGGEFVELSGVQLLRPVPAGAAGPVIEIASATGLRVTVRLADGQAVDVPGLIETVQRHG